VKSQETTSTSTTQPGNEKSPPAVNDKLVEQAQRQQQIWEASREGIADSLDIASAVLPPELETTVLDAVEKLPVEVREFVCERCRFIHVPSPGGGLTVNYEFIGKYSRPWLVFLTDGASKELVAHEIGHAWLNHYGSGEGQSGEEVGQQEIAASEIAATWGFDMNKMLDNDRSAFERHCTEALYRFVQPKGGDNMNEFFKIVQDLTSLKATKVTGSTCVGELRLSPIDLGYDLRLHPEQPIELPDHFESVGLAVGDDVYLLEGPRDQLIAAIKAAGYVVANKRAGDV